MMSCRTNRLPAIARCMDCYVMGFDRFDRSIVVVSLAVKRSISEVYIVPSAELTLADECNRSTHVMYVRRDRESRRRS